MALPTPEAPATVPTPTNIPAQSEGALNTPTALTPEAIPAIPVPG